MLENLLRTKKTTLLTTIKVELKGVSRSETSLGKDPKSLENDNGTGTVVISTGGASSGRSSGGVVVSANDDGTGGGGTGDGGDDGGLVEGVGMCAFLRIGYQASMGPLIHG